MKSQQLKIPSTNLWRLKASNRCGFSRTTVVLAILAAIVLIGGFYSQIHTVNGYKSIYDYFRQERSSFPVAVNYKMRDSSWPVPQEDLQKFIEDDICKEIFKYLETSESETDVAVQEFIPSSIQIKVVEPNGIVYARMNLEHETPIVGAVRIADYWDKVQLATEQCFRRWLQTQEQKWLDSPDGLALTIDQVWFEKGDSRSESADIFVQFSIKGMNDSTILDVKRRCSTNISSFNGNKQHAVELISHHIDYVNQGVIWNSVQSNEQTSPKKNFEVTLQIQFVRENQIIPLRLLRATTSVEVPDYISNISENSRSF